MKIGEKYSGTVEVDETFIGGKARNMHRDKRARLKKKLTKHRCRAVREKPS